MRNPSMENQKKDNDRQQRRCKPDAQQRRSKAIIYCIITTFQYLCDAIQEFSIKDSPRGQASDGAALQTWKVRPPSLVFPPGGPAWPGSLSAAGSSPDLPSVKQDHEDMTWSFLLSKSAIFQPLLYITPMCTCWSTEIRSSLIMEKALTRQESSSSSPEEEGSVTRIVKMVHHWVLFIHNIGYV